MTKTLYPSNLQILQEIEAIMAADIRKIIYVSCNPETQIRDIRILAKAGYRVRKAVPVDNFPFTRHIETIVLLQKLNS